VYFLCHIIYGTGSKVNNNNKMNYDKANHKLAHNKSIAESKTLQLEHKDLFRRGNFIKFKGIDERHETNATSDEIEKRTIFENIEKKFKLDILEDNTISIYEKLELLRDNSIKPVNLAAGDLMNDFEFDIDSDMTNKE
jgi:hypothetical protein